MGVKKLEVPLLPIPWRAGSRPANAGLCVAGSKVESLFLVVLL